MRAAGIREHRHGNVSGVRTLLPLVASAATRKAVNGGATTTSQWFDDATSGLSFSTKSTASPMVLYIFQLPAMTGFLMVCSPI
jgi:hypothetical protein